jgi:hypothetical protein
VARRQQDEQRWRDEHHEGAFVVGFGVALVLNAVIIGLGWIVMRWLW